MVLMSEHCNGTTHIFIHTSIKRCNVLTNVKYGQNQRKCYQEKIQYLQKASILYNKFSLSRALLHVLQFPMNGKHYFAFNKWKVYSTFIPLVFSLNFPQLNYFRHPVKLKVELSICVNCSEISLEPVANFEPSKFVVAVFSVEMKICWIENGSVMWKRNHIDTFKQTRLKVWNIFKRLFFFSTRIVLQLYLVTESCALVVFFSFLFFPAHFHSFECCVCSHRLRIYVLNAILLHSLSAKWHGLIVYVR